MKGLCVVALVGVALAAQAQEPPQAPFRAVAHSVAVDVSVLNGQRAIPGLTAADFEVRENGVRQRLADVRPNTLPIDVRLLFDTSGSITAEELERYRRAMARVAEALRPEDRVEILTFSGRISEVVPLQHPPIRIITQRQDRDGTSFFDAVSLAMVTRPSVPASSMMRASRWCCLAFRTSWGMPSRESSLASSSLFSMETVPTRMGWPLAWRSLMSATMAASFSLRVL